VIEGRPEPSDAPLLAAKPRYIDSETRLLVAGRIEKGGLTVGLLKGPDWVMRVEVTEPGDFIAMLAPPASGWFAITLAPAAGGGASLSATLSRIDVIPPMRPAK
jgi:hypothetical protein